MPGRELTHFHSITELHHLMGLPRPEHPLISVINLEALKYSPENRPGNAVFDFYSIALKWNCHGEMKYGQQQYHFQEGTLYCMAPGQVFGRIDTGDKPTITPMSGWILYIHPDFLWNTPLAKTIKRYAYFDYSVNEALNLSEKEEAVIIGLMQNIQGECLANADNFSQDIIIALVEVMLNYTDRFFHRQFLTRKIENHEILARLEVILTDCFNSDRLLERGLPSVQFVAGKLNISPNYLSSLLKVLTGRNTQQHIQDKMIDKAKEIISTTELSVSEISVELGFEHPQSFSRLFKAKTGLSPLAFRQTFN